MARRHQVYGLATWWHEVAPAPVKCQAADRVAALGTVSGTQEHARHADTSAFSTSLQAPLLVCKGSVAGCTHMTVVMRSGVQCGAQRVFCLGAREALAAKEVTHSQTHRDTELRMRQLVASALRPAAAG